MNLFPAFALDSRDSRRPIGPRRRWWRWTWLLFALGISASVRGDDWPQWRGPQRDGVWRETGVVRAFASPQLRAKWSQPVGPGYSGPTVAGGRVYLTDRQTQPDQIERVHCWDAETGRVLWTHTYACQYVGVGYEAGPRAAVTIDRGRAFALGSMGDLHALDAMSGKVLWHHRLHESHQIEMPIWGIASAPLIYEDLVIVQIGGKPQACVVAFDVATGEERWRSLDDRASYSAPIVIRQGEKDVLVVWTGDNVAGLDPRTGVPFWQSPMPPKNMVIGIATPIIDNDLLFVTSFYDGSKMMRLNRDRPAAEELWRQQGDDEQHTKALHSIISTPLLLDGHIYGVDSYGELRCLNAQTGERIWEDQRATPRDRWSNIHLIRHDKDVWMFNERGELIITQLSPEGYTELSRAKLIEPTIEQLNRRGKGVCWAHPAFANRHVFIRSDDQVLCASLADPASP